MFRNKSRGQNQVTIIAAGLKISGNVEAEGSVELHGEIEGELHCTSLRIAEKGRVTGKVVAENVDVNGSVYGPIYGTHVKLEPNAHVTGDVHHESFTIEKGAFFDGRSKQKDVPETKLAPQKKAAAKLNSSSAAEPRNATSQDQAMASTAV